MDQQKIRVLMADAQAISRHGLRYLLERAPTLEVVGEATSGLEAIQMAISLEPDVVLMDIKLPELNGFEATRRIRRACPHIGVLILTTLQDEFSIFPALRAGAHGYLLKDAKPAQLISAIEMVAEGGAIFGPAVAPYVLPSLSMPRANLSNNAFNKLTDREREILGLLAQGSSTGEIATFLNLSPKTVSNNISSILKRTRLTDRVQLILLASGQNQGDKLPQVD